MEDQTRKEAFLSAGGPGVGSTWIKLPQVRSAYLPSAYFRIATQSRLGAKVLEAKRTCNITKAGSKEVNEELCGHDLDEALIHPQLCGEGVARMRPHRDITATFAKVLQRTRAEVDLERAVPELNYEKDGKLVEAS
jgi:hypothetical protein